MGALSLEVVTPGGTEVLEPQVDKVVLRRKEERFDIGSEVVLLPGHGPLLARLPEHDIRWVTQTREVTMHIGEGYAEVVDGRIVIVTSKAGPATLSQDSCGTGS